MKTSIKLISLAVGLTLAQQTHAAVMQYGITLRVTTAGKAPGSYSTNPWSFSSIPVVYTGTFSADDTATGPISNFSLIVGGLNLATSHPGSFFNSFNPSTLQLVWGQLDPSGLESYVAIGAAGGPGGGTQGSSSAAAIENSQVGPIIDPNYGFTQNWAGDFSVSAVSAIPEPTTALGVSVILSAGLLLRQRQRRN